jgi:hypothetical protein
MTHPDESRITTTYIAYLVRMWQEDEEIPWRASAQSARTGEKFYFSDLESLFLFLRAQTDADSHPLVFTPDADESHSD